MQFNFKILLIVFLFTSLRLYAGDFDRRKPRNDLVFESGFVHNGAGFWASGGAGIANTENPEALLYNPAWNNKDGYLILAGGLKRFETDFGYTGENIKIDGELLAPAYFLAAARYKKWLFNAGYRTFYNFTIKFKNEIVTIEHPEGTGEYYSNIESKSVKNIFMGVNRPLTDHLSAGVQAGLLLYSFKSSTHNFNSSNSGFSYDFKAGLFHKYTERISASLVFHYLKRIKYDYEYKGIRFVNDEGEEIPFKEKRKFIMPWFLDLGFQFWQSDYLQFMFKIQYQYWQEISKYMDNRLQLALGFSVFPNEYLKLRLGAFTMGDYLQNTNDTEDTAFLTAGIDYQPSPSVAFSLSVLSSRFFAGKTQYHSERIKRTEILFGIQWKRSLLDF
ncbi:MAG: hypothetical protein GXO77_10280 [Calditrichaeota bacterium]|nr:hypothetical protein [Calditrichota bacterium]